MRATPAAEAPPGLCANEKRSSVIHDNEAALRLPAPDVRLMAAKEGLTAHSPSIDVRP